jgi:hypothetical protein
MEIPESIEAALLDDGHFAHCLSLAARTAARELRSQNELAAEGFEKLGDPILDFSINNLADHPCESPIEKLLLHSLMISAYRNWIIPCFRHGGATDFESSECSQIVLIESQAVFWLKGRKARVDAVVYCPAFPERYVVECDGYEFHSSKEKFEADRKRDRAIQAMGYQTRRYSGSEIKANHIKLSFDLLCEVCHL